MGFLVREKHMDMTLPPEVSKSSDNAYYSAFCNEVGYRPSYAVCLHKIEQRKEGRLDTVWSECSAAIGAKRCPALRMAREEKDKGQAMFFMSRQEIQEQNAIREAAANEKFTRMMETGHVSSRRKTYSEKDFAPVPKVERPYVPKAAPAAAPKAKDADEMIATGGFAEAITRSLAKPAAAPVERKIEVAAPVKKPEPAVKPEVKPVKPMPVIKPGMSPLEIARMMAAAK